MTAEVATPDPDSGAKRVPCEDGRLLIQDLPAVDSAWQQPLEVETDLARDWHTDSHLIQMRVTCQLFEPGFRIQATFFSDEAQAVYAADTNESEPYEVGENQIMPTLDVSVVSFAALRQELLDADFPDDAELLPSTGVDVRINSAVAPFGPETVPLGATLSHVSIERLGEVRDLFVEPSTGDIYRFASPGD